MNTLDRLLLKVTKPDKRLDLSLISFDRERQAFKLMCLLWDGVLYSGTENLISWHETKEDAELQLEVIKQKYNGNNAPVIIDFISCPEGE